MRDRRPDEARALLAVLGERCEACGGSGNWPPAFAFAPIDGPLPRCPTCNGTGEKPADDAEPDGGPTAG